MQANSLSGPAHKEFDLAPELSKTASPSEVSALETSSEAAAGCRSTPVNVVETAPATSLLASNSNDNSAPGVAPANQLFDSGAARSVAGASANIDHIAEAATWNVAGASVNANGRAGDFQASAIGAAAPRVAASSTEQQNSSAASPVRLSNTTISEADDWFISVDPFFNSANPCYVLKRERPEHRVIVYLKAQGFSYVEIAERVGWSAPGVANVCKQKWAQDLLLKEITKAGRNRVEHILSGEALNSVLKLVTLRDDDDAPKEVQRKAANDLLDRVYGKPTLPLQHTHIDPKKVSDEELARIAQQGKVN